MQWPWVGWGEVGVRGWGDAVYWLASHGLLSLLSYRTQDHQPWDGTVPRELGPPTSIIKEENVLQCLL